MIQIGSKVQCKNRSQQTKRRANLKKGGLVLCFLCCLLLEFSAKSLGKSIPQWSLPQSRMSVVKDAKFV